MNRVPCYHFTLDPTDYVVGSEYTTVFFPLTLKKTYKFLHLRYLYSLITPRLSKLIKVILRNVATTLKGRRIVSKGMEGKFNLIFLEQISLDAAKQLVLGDNHPSYLL